MVTFKETIMKVLEDKNEPMHFRDITNEVLKTKETKGKTPEGTVNAILMRNSTLFHRVSIGKFGLTKWNGEAKTNEEAERYR